MTYSLCGTRTHLQEMYPRSLSLWQKEGCNGYTREAMTGGMFTARQLFNNEAYSQYTETSRRPAAMTE
jgi:hypothetical protein